LVLVDAGARLQSAGYGGDVSRTFPARERFTPAQRAIYEMVLDVQNKVIDKVKAGVSPEELNALTLESFASYL